MNIFILMRYIIMHNVKGVTLKDKTTQNYNLSTVPLSSTEHFSVFIYVLVSRLATWLFSFSLTAIMSTMSSHSSHSRQLQGRSSQTPL